VQILAVLNVTPIINVTSLNQVAVNAAVAYFTSPEHIGFETVTLTFLARSAAVVYFP